MWTNIQVWYKKKKKTDFNTALDSDLLAQSSHSDYLKAEKEKLEEVNRPWSSL